MNEKAFVTKELNAKHAKILLGLLKLPENKECADCRSKAPRWASINLGIFICMRCSGIHRSLGVHISKVRSTTLDTWLPEQVAFMQVMGNQKSNSYWEADLPAQFYRSPIETFIYAKYVDRRWAPTTPQPIPEICAESTSTRKEIPKKARRYSLDEEFFVKEMPKIAPPKSHCRAESFSFMDAIDSAPPLISFEGCSSSKNVDTGTDLFSLLYVSEETQDRTVVPPSRWASFE
ncbi:probable ADP-ribosylation factor GTPase-activating protein AGD15 [Salvia miltiorrhiza]|uniref:probable ADP-ribosylation factor GTPase-activating protein AGD15 n=1 Tax=Salvia miltiorrhiza TaxID=226208 RepID=UPI0025ACA106|nr:probable ADP-ribosylation factor GTPase-activating protein AGD15 [Salvia miltiorrhiza]XP_057804131.1 probable ADP-ribosylation factor GTPase-activating protein AGD15 [Salvia miltiorrhiza]